MSPRVGYPVKKKFKILFEGFVSRDFGGFRNPEHTYTPQKLWVVQSWTRWLVSPWFKVVGAVNSTALTRVNFFELTTKNLHYCILSNSQSDMWCQQEDRDWIGLDTHGLPSSQKKEKKTHTHTHTHKYMDDSSLDKVVGFPLVQGGGTGAVN